LAPGTLAVSVLGPPTGPSVQFALATPFASVVTVAGATEPLPLATEKVTCTPAITFPSTSFTTTAGAVCTAVFTIAACWLPRSAATLPGTATRPLAWNTTVPSPVPGTVATSALAPTAAPSVQPPTVATPLASLIASGPVTEPPPAVTAKLTVTPATPLPKASVTFTAGRVLAAEPITPFCPSPANAMIAAAAPGVADALKVTLGRLPETAVTVCVSVLLFPSVHVVDTVPSAPVVAVAGLTEPAPPVTANSTGCPATPAPLASTTFTFSWVASAVFTVPACASPCTFCMAAGGSACLCVGESDPEHPHRESAATARASGLRMVGGSSRGAGPQLDGLEMKTARIAPKRMARRHRCDSGAVVARVAFGDDAEQRRRDGRPPPRGETNTA